VHIWKKIGAAAAALAMVGGGTLVGAAWAGDDPSAQPPDGASGQTSSGDVATNGLLGGGTTEDSFVAITPCRIIDTREAGGALQVGGSRVFDVAGGGATFAAQGGKAGGCGIPNLATAIEATITTVDSGSGFLRAYPANAPAPNATFMNYTPVFNASNTGTLAINGCTGICLVNTDLRLRAYGTATHVVVDVNGYYVRPMGAVVSSAGALLDGNRVTRASTLATGQYEIGFDRDVSECAYGVTLYNSTTGNTVTAAPRTGEADAVFVRVVNESNASENQQFHLTVTC